MTADEPSLDLVVFRAGGSRFAVEARHVAGMRAGTATCPDGAVVLAPVGQSPMRLLDLVQGAVLVAEEPVAALRVAAAAIHPLPAPIAARIEKPEVRALLWDEDGLIVVADASRFPRRG